MISPGLSDFRKSFVCFALVFILVNHRIIALAAPALNIIPASPVICIGSSVTLTANTADDPAITYSWSSSPPGFSATTRIITVNPTTTTNYTVIITDGNNNTSLENVRVTVNPKITPTFASIPAICSGASPPSIPTTSIDGITGSWSPAFNNTATTTYTFTPAADQCATTVTLTVTVNQNTLPTFNPVAAICNGAPAPVLPTTSTNGISGTWSPSTVSNTTTGTYTFTPSPGQCASATTLTVTVNQGNMPTFSIMPTICSGAAPPALPTTSTNGITGTWNPATVNNTTTGTYTFTPTEGQCASPVMLTITVDPATAPIFTPIGAICTGAVPPELPTTSINGITGTWNPATVSNSSTGTYIFTPASGSCLATALITVTVNPIITPSFASIPALCSGATAPTLPATSLEGITGSWSPAFNNTATTTYTFTPIAGQCATSTTLTVAVNPNILPTFNPFTTICHGAPAPLLQTTSTNGITGTWSPAAVSNTTTGTYTFTPSPGQCALQASFTVTVLPNSTTSFSQIGPLCLNSTPPPLPISSNNTPSITGTWNPATISTVSLGTTAYTFTPAAGQCASTVSMNITIVNQITPTFAAIGQLCQNSTPPLLPVNSTNNPAIAGTWSPSAINTAAAGSTTYTFTPTGSTCAISAALNIAVADLITPTFAAVGPLCQNSIPPLLPLSSANTPAITGTWSPSSINTAATGTTNYTFTPADGQCALPTSMDITVAPKIKPTIAPIGPLCQNSTAPVLPVSSNDMPAITGTWSPATINTATAGTTTYTFTPTGNLCTEIATLNIVTTARVAPTFDPIGPLCQNSTAPSLPLSSTNTPSITGTWSPATISTATLGTTSYTFTPAAGQCASATTIDITIATQIIPIFTAFGLCQNSTAPSLPVSSTNNPAIAGTWSPATINTAASGITTYTFTPTGSTCATTATLAITISAQVTPSFTAIGPLCQNSIPPALPAVSNNTPAITGTWSPATISTATPGTAVYTFTPSGSSCATSTTLTIETTALVTPTFAAIGQLCQNSPAPLLPASSTNTPAITGTWNPATISTATPGIRTYTFTATGNSCTSDVAINIETTAQITPTFAAIGPLCLDSPAPLLPAGSTNTPAIIGTWSPATISTTTPGTTTYTFTPASGQCASAATLNITIVNQITPTFTAIGPLCLNSTAPSLPLNSINTPAINGTWSPATISTTTLGTTTYTFTPASGQCASAASLNITIANQITPTFTAIGPLCLNSTAPSLPTNSTNTPAINGTWSPATINTAFEGTTTYTFIPSASGCITNATLAVTVSSSITPTFSAIPSICSGAEAPIFPVTSIDGITGSWAPAFNNTATTTYTFTPAAGQCAHTVPLTVAVNPNIVPLFNPVSTICNGAPAPVLPATSINGIIGTWNPATVNNTATGTYAFTPSSGQCATTTTLTVTVDPDASPTFSQIGPLCLFTITPTLPVTSTNGITGSWNPSVISSAARGTTAYTFIPFTGCRVPVIMDIEIASQITPVFTQIKPVCQGSVPPLLPAVSNNGISGTWSPSTVSNNTTGTYTFTPTAGQCETTATLNVTVTPNIIPTFASIPAICSGAASPGLPTTSIDGITGSWSPAFNNTATTTYTFTPDAGQCATTVTLTIVVNPNAHPTFNPVSAVCYGTTAPVLPTTSTNGISGTWSPSTVSNTTTDTYTFIASSGQCATTTTLSVTVNPNITPTFSQIGPLCLHSPAPVLPVVSTNTPAITGIWSPATIQTIIAGTTTYTFSPSADQCPTLVTMDIITTTLITPVFTPIGTLYQNSIPPALPVRSADGITGTWLPATISTAIVGSATYTFTPDPGQCASTATLVIPVGMLALITTVEPQSTVGSCTQVKLDASKSVGDIVKYEWSVSQGGILTGQTGVTNEFVLSPTYSGSLPADFYVKLVVTNRQGATQSDSIPIKVDSLPDVAFYSAGTLEADGSMIVDTIDSSGTISEFRWFSPEGKIIGPNDRPSVRLFGPGTYTLEITDLYGCKAAKNYTIPAEVYQIIVNPDYAAILWAKDTTLMVLENDQSVVSFIIGSVQITRQPARGSARVNTNGSITYLPDQLQTGRDQFVYEVCNSANICASATVTIDIYEIGIVIPNGFSPNGDGINEKLEFLRLENYLQTKLYVYTRSGQLVYQSDDYKNDWDGATIQSSLTSKKTVPTGIYFYVLKPGGTNRLLKGFVYIGY